MIFSYTPASGAGVELFGVKNTGKFYIGSNNTPGDYKLYVAGGILTEKVKVALLSSSDWADYVFKPDYHLMPLDEVRKFIAENCHLPGMLTAEEVKKQGLDVAKSDAKLLEKIEELTLYILQLESRLLKLENQ